MTALPADLLDSLRNTTRRAVAAGFDPPDRIAENAAEMVAGDSDADPDDLRATATRLTAEALAAHLRDQDAWPDTTDCDRLDTAFEALEAAGIVARQNFSCCGTCGHVDISEEIGRAEEAGREVRGYTFYHIQNTDAGVEGHGLYLAYGATEDGQAGAEAVAAEVVAALTAHGLKPQWNGSARQCVYVPLVWQRRRPAVITARPTAAPPVSTPC